MLVFIINKAIIEPLGYFKTQTYILHNIISRLEKKMKKEGMYLNYRILQIP